MFEDLGKRYDLFNRLPTIKILTDLFLPLSEEEEMDEDTDFLYKYFVSNGKSTVLWEILRAYEFDKRELKGLSLEDINTSSMFPVLVKTFIERCSLEELGEEFQTSTYRVFNEWVNKAPDLLYANTCVSQRSDAREILIQMMREWEENNKQEFKKLRISLPADIYTREE